MNPKLRKMLEVNGLRKDATEAEAWAKYDEMKKRGFDFEGIEIGTRSAAAVPAGDSDSEGQRQQAGGQRAQDSFTQDDIDRATVRALAADASRRNEIEDVLMVAGLTDHNNGDFARSLLSNPECTVDQARKAVFAELKKRNPAFGAGAHGVITVGVEAGQKLRAAISDGLAQRAGIVVKDPAEGAREFRGRSLIEVCRELLVMGGVDVRGLTAMQIAGRALTAGSTSDFPDIFGGLVNQTLLRAYTEWPSTFRPFVAVTSANDFKAIHSVSLSGSPDLLDLNENGEYKQANFSDSKESYNIITKGIMVALTRQMIINDDLRAFTRIPQLFGAAAKRMEGDAVYALITANGAMSDGIALFHADHNNLGTAAVISSGSLSAGRAMMRKQTGKAGEAIDVQPAFLLCPVGKETDAEVLLRSAALPESQMSAGVHNPWAGKLTPIADPRLDAASATAWYLLAHPNQVPTIEVAYLQGEEQPYVEEMMDFDSDALKIKVRHDFGAGKVDYVGAYKNAGA